MNPGPYQCNDTESLCIIAVDRDDINTLKNNITKEFNRSAVIHLHWICIRYGYIDILKFLIEYGYPLYVNVHYCHHASIGGQYDMLRFLRSKNAIWDIWTIIWAANLGHIDILRWALNNGCPYDKQRTYQYALEGNNIDIIEFLKNRDQEPHMAK